MTQPHPEIELGKDEAEALKVAGLFERFCSMAPSHQREYHLWVSEAKKPETRARRINQMVEMLRASHRAPH